MEGTALLGRCPCLSHTLSCILDRPPAQWLCLFDAPTITVPSGEGPCSPAFRIDPAVLGQPSLLGATCWGACHASPWPSTPQGPWGHRQRTLPGPSRAVTHTPSPLGSSFSGGFKPSHVFPLLALQVPGHRDLQGWPGWVTLLCLHVPTLRSCSVASVPVPHPP